MIFPCFQLLLQLAGRRFHEKTKQKTYKPAGNEEQAVLLPLLGACQTEKRKQKPETPNKENICERKEKGQSNQVMQESWENSITQPKREEVRYQRSAWN